MNMRWFGLSVLLLLACGEVRGGLITGMVGYGVCQSVCSSAWVACYAAAGFVAGTVTAGLGTPAAILACNVAHGACQASCYYCGVASGVAGPV